MSRARRGGSDSEAATLRRYLKEISRYPTVDHDTEMEFARKVQAGDLEKLLPADTSAGELRESFERAMAGALPGLPQLERRALELRYGLGGSAPIPLREMGATLGVPGEEVAEVESRALHLLHEDGVDPSIAGYLNKEAQDAAKKLVEANLRFVVAYAKRYRNPNVSFLDLIHEGNLGLIQAAKKYDPFQEKQDVKFITYAVWWIRQAILHALAEHAGSFRLPQKQANTLYRLERIRSLLTDRFGRTPTDKELSQELNISVDDVRVLTRASQTSLSLNDPVDDEGDSELGDLLEQTVLPDTDERILRESFLRALTDALDELPERERKVLELRFGLQDDQPKTLREIGEMLGLSRERVRQIESRALNKLRRSHTTRSLAGYLN